MPKPSLTRGIDRRAEMVVPPEFVVPQVSDHLSAFADMPPVFATVFMVAFVEATCIETVRDHLLEGERTVGTLINLSHIAPTPPGMIVRASVNLVDIDDRCLRFSVAVWDEKEVIGDGWHERAIIDMSRFMTKVANKVDLSL